MNVSNQHMFTIGDIVSFTLSAKQIDHEPFRPTQRNPYPVVTSRGGSHKQLYKVIRVLVGGDSIIPERRYTACSYLENGEKIQALEVEPFPLVSEYGAPNWFINVTHMAISQNVDAMPLHIIDTLTVHDKPKLPKSVMIARRLREKYDNAINSGTISESVPLNEAYEHDGFDTEDEIDTQSAYNRKYRLEEKALSDDNNEVITSVERKELEMLSVILI